MTEVRSSSAVGGGKGLFATRDYAVGEVILHEAAPLAQLASPGSSAVVEQQILDELLLASVNNNNNNKKKSLRDCIAIPPNVAAEGAQQAAKFVAMIQAALCFVWTVSSDSQPSEPPGFVESLLQLFHPPLEEEEDQDGTAPASSSCAEQQIVSLARQALQQLQAMAKPGSPLERQPTELLLQVMLIWACNAFEGGRIYRQTSRINHSCDPNAVVNDSNDSSMIVRAAAPISRGTEITISYLGSFLYADRTTRRDALRRDKFMEQCACARCCSESKQDTADAIPCPACHPRQVPGKRQLEEDVQYDDEQTVHYVCPGGAGATWRCRACGWSFVSQVAGSGTASSGGSSKSEDEKLLQTSRSVVDKVVDFLQEHEASQKQKPIREEDGDGDDDDDDEDDEAQLVQRERLEQHLRMASSVLGARHWTTNLLLLLRLDQNLQEFHARLLSGEWSSFLNDDDDDSAEKVVVMETIAEYIDILERLCRFVDGLALQRHMGHLLSDVIVGTARALVSLGDVKSQKYAAECWLEKIGDFVTQFDSDGMKKVVQTLRVAWQRSEPEGSNDGADTNGATNNSSRPEKRAKR